MSLKAPFFVFWSESNWAKVLKKAKNQDEGEKLSPTISLPWVPPGSPDLNFIDNLLELMKGDIEKKDSTKPKESIEVIEQKWDDITYKF